MSKADNAQDFSPAGGLLNLGPRDGINDVTKGFKPQNKDIDTEALYKEAQSLFAQKKYQNCVTKINEIFRANPQHPGAMELQGLIAMAQFRFETAEIIYRQLTEQSPDNPDFKIILGETYLHQSRYAQAESLFSETVSMPLDNGQKAKALFGLSKAALSLGQLENAQEAIKGALEAAPKNPEILYFYVTFFVRPGENDAQLIETLKTLLQQTQNEESRILLSFALSKLLRLTGQDDEAFTALKSACDAKRKNIKYNPKEVSQQIDSIINYFSEQAVLKSGLAGIKSERPVFIVAMPRSGTTLLEQILTTHPEIGSIGESVALSSIIETNSYLPPKNGQTYPLRPVAQGRFLPCEAIAHQYNNYLLAEKGPDLKRVINKGMSARLHVGLIYMMFPNARFIHIRRNPLDCLLSCYSTNFTGNTQPYSYDLKELALFYRDHVRLTRHWENILPQENWLNVSYEELVSSPESQIREILSFLGLEWDPACLQAEKSKNQVASASAAQVRRPVHTQAIGKWMAWEDYIKPLTEELEKDL